MCSPRRSMPDSARGMSTPLEKRCSRPCALASVVTSRAASPRTRNQNRTHRSSIRQRSTLHGSAMADSERIFGGNGARRSDALVLFGVTGDLAHKMIFPALYALTKKGALKVPVIGVASSKWSLAQLRRRATDSIRAGGRVSDRHALHRLLSRLRYVEGDYND